MIKPRVVTIVGVCIAAFGVLVLFSMSIVHFITPREVTTTAIGEAFYRVHRYAKKNNELPTSFDRLPRRKNYANRTTAGWENETTIFAAAH